MKWFFLVFTLICLFSCKKQDSEFTFAVGSAANQIEYWHRIIKEYEDKTQIKVNLLRQPTESKLRRQGLVLASDSKSNNPDVFLMDVIWINQLAESNWLVSFNPYIKESNFEISEFFQPLLDQVDIYGGKVFALPVYVDCGLLYYRTDVIRKYNCSIPETWDELLSCSLKVQKGEGVENSNFYAFVW